MPKIQSNDFSRLSIGFKPAELRKGSDWLVVYYCLNPQTNKLQRFRNRVPKISNLKERNKYAQRMVEVLNEKLFNGWSPFMDINDKKLQKIDDCIKTFFSILDKENEENLKRKSTIYNYLKKLRDLQSYISKHKNIVFISQIDTLFISDYLEKIYLEKNINSRTYNSYISILKIFFNFCVSKGYISQTPMANIKKKNKTPKKRVVFNEDELQKLKDYKAVDFGFYVFAMSIYYCFIRPNELLQLKVKDVDLQKGTITIPASISKNKKTQIVTIPNIFLQDLEKHIANTDNDFYLFGLNFKPNNKKRTQYFHCWIKFKQTNNIREEVQLYSLKDTGITNLLKAGVPAIKVRDQARHSSLLVTETYTTKNTIADDTIKNAFC